MQSSLRADYRPGGRLSLAPVDREKILAQTLKDELDLLRDHSLEMAGPPLVALLPQPTLLLQPTLSIPSPVPTLTPTTTPLPSAEASPPTETPQTSLPPPTSGPGTSPTTPPPTTLPTPPATDPPPTAPPATSTSPPPTSPPPTSPPDDDSDNQSPVLKNDVVTVAEDTSVTIKVLANDIDPDGMLVRSTLSVVDGPASGRVIVNKNAGEIAYTPKVNFNGTDSFGYRVCDNENACQRAEVKLTITPVYDAPIAVDDSFPTTLEDTAVNIDVLANDTNVDGAALSISSTTAPVNGGTVRVNPDETITYTPPFNFNGIDTFSYTLSDGISSDTATVTVTVAGVNDPPVAVDDLIMMPEDGSQFIDVRDNDIDPDTPTNLLVITGVTAATTGTVVVELPGVRYTPPQDFNGNATFSYTISDGEFADTAMVTVTVSPVNDLPLIVDDNVTTNQDTPVAIDVLANDSDAEGLDPTSVTVITNPLSGTVSVDGITGVTTYTPNVDFIGVDAFEYRACDNNIPTPACGTATVTVIVNDGPPAAPTNLAAATGDSQVVLGWDANLEADFDFYELFRDGSLITATITTSYLDQSVTNDVTYTYTVRAVDAAGNASAFSNVVTVRPYDISSSEFPTDLTCNGDIPDCNEAEGGPPDGGYAEIDPGETIVFDFGAGQGIIDGSGFDLVLYERENPVGSNRILLDFMTIEVSTDGATWFTVYNWDGQPGGVSGTNVDGYATDGDGEQDDEVISTSDLFNNTGIAIDIGPWTSPGYSFQFVRFSHPGGPNPAEVDAIQRLN